MSSKDLIHIVDVPGIDMDYAISHIDINSWGDAIVAPSRLHGYGESLDSKQIRNASIAQIDSSFYKLLQDTLTSTVLNYAKENNIKISTLEGYHVARYSEGQFFKDHVDTTEEFPRKISIVVYLNDNYSGGNITFTKLGLSFKPKASTAFIFPSTEEFSHFAEPVLSGIKYVVVGFWS